MQVWCRKHLSPTPFQEIRLFTRSLGPARQTGYEAVPDPEKPGFGDRLTANTLRGILACDLPAPLARSNYAATISQFPSPDPVATPYGSFFIEVFSCGGAETLVLHTRDIPGRTEEVVCRIQSECVSHLFDSSCDCANQISSSLSRIYQAGGLLIYLRQDGMGLGLAATLDNDSRDCREYHVAVDILNHYSIRSVHLISLDKRKIESLEQAPCPIRDLAIRGMEGESSPWVAK